MGRGNRQRTLQDRGVIPHIALQSEIGWRGAKIIPPDGYEISQRSRKRIEEIFARVKTVASLAKTKFRGRQRVAQGFELAVAAYDLVRLPKLVPQAARGPAP